MTSRSVPWWGAASSALAPVALIGGWTLAAAVHPSAFSSVDQTISALAASDAPNRWIMTTAFLVVGLCHLVTAAALRPAAPLGRAVLAVGGAAAWGVAAFPLPPQTVETESVGHTAFAFVSFVALAVWPVLASRGTHGVLGRRAGAVVTAVLLAQLAWFTAALGSGDLVGLAERIAAGSQALWPLVVVLLLRRSADAGTPQRRRADDAAER